MVAVAQLNRLVPVLAGLLQQAGAEPLPKARR